MMCVGEHVLAGAWALQGADGRVGGCECCFLSRWVQAAASGEYQKWEAGTIVQVRHPRGSRFGGWGEAGSRGPQRGKAGSPCSWFIAPGL